MGSNSIFCFKYVLIAAIRCRYSIWWFVVFAWIDDLWVIHDPSHSNQLGVSLMKNPAELGLINPQRVQLPQGLVNNCQPRHQPDAEIYNAIRLGRFSPRPLIPIPLATTPVANWTAVNPEGFHQEAIYDLGDAQGEVSGELVRKGRNAYVSSSRLHQCEAFTKADARFVKMQRTRKSKRGHDLLGFAQAELEEATMQVASIESQIAFLKKALKQRHVGKLRISKKKKAYAKINLPLLKKQLPKWKKKLRKFTRIVAKYDAKTE
jgi:hypothetical protein